MTRLLNWLEQRHRRSLTRYSTRQPKSCVTTTRKAQP